MIITEKKPPAPVKKHEDETIHVFYCRACKDDTLHLLTSPERLDFGAVIVYEEGKLECVDCTEKGAKN